MTKEEAIDYMCKEVVSIERKHLSQNTSVENKRKKEIVDSIVNTVKEIEISDEN